MQASVLEDRGHNLKARQRLAGDDEAAGVSVQAVADGWAEALELFCG